MANIAGSGSVLKAKRFNNSGKNRKASNGIQNLPNTLMTYPRKRIFPIFVSNHGIHMLSETCHRIIRNHCFNLDNSASLKQLKYVLCLAYLNRIIQCGRDGGYHIDSFAVQLEYATKAVRLPIPLCEYIEAIGTVTLSNGITVAPWVADRSQLLDPHLNQLDPDSLLQETDQPIPNNYWSIHHGWIQDWNCRTSELYGLVMPLRTINWSNRVGRLEMVVTPKITSDNFWLPTAPQLVPDCVAQLGAAYDFRRFENSEQWPAETAYICSDLTHGSELLPNAIFSELILKSITNRY